MISQLLLLPLLSLPFIEGQDIPELCTIFNQGECECGSGDIKTYVFQPGPFKRCIHTYIPDGYAGQALPVLISVNGYGQGTLPPFGPTLAKAAYHGFALFGIGSTGPFNGVFNFGLQFPANGVVNASNPTPCEESDSRDYAYIKGVLDFIDSQESLDSSKVYFEGFSQNSMYAAYASVCFADRVAGLWQGGSGLSKTYHAPVTPGFEGQCSATNFAAFGDECCDQNFCNDCTWWPIYPRTCESKLIDCIATYNNDNLACGGDFYMYEAMVEEGNDARMLSFPAGIINDGGHRNPDNAMSWIVGCLGIVDSCSALCEESFLTCVNGSGPNEYRRCEFQLSLGNLENCVIGCAPTLGMLLVSEEPEVINLREGKFGTQSGLDVAIPQTPNCELDFGSFDEIGFDPVCTPPNGSGPAEGEIEACNAPTPTAPTPTAPTPTAPTPTVTGCQDDSSLRFKLEWKGKTITRDCTWVANRATVQRCNVSGVKEMCSETCDNCDTCADSSSRFKVTWNNKLITRDCTWVANKATIQRCNLDGVKEACCETCS